jgi:8-oxo-dGTP pyrophosphatase MutT (NUDIX family)
MKPLMSDKRENSTLIPYRRIDGELFFYLQKRSDNAPRMPGVFGMFGGGFEPGETPEQALYREIMEELVYVPQHPVYFSRYEHGKAILHLFVEEVASDFESKVEVKEGDFGKFFSASEVVSMEKIAPMARIAVPQIVEVLNKK